MLNIFLLMCMNLDGCPVGQQIKIDNNILIWDIFMPERSCLLISIGRRRIKYHPNIFEVEVEFCLQISPRKNILWIVMHMNICWMILGVSIWWDNNMVVHNMKKVCLMWWITFSSKGSWWLSCDQYWSHQVSFKILVKYLICMIQYFFQLCLWHSYYQGVIQSMW